MRGVEGEGGPAAALSMSSEACGSSSGSVSYLLEVLACGRAREGRCSLRQPGRAGGGCGAGDPPGPSGSGSPAPAQYAPGPRSGTLSASVSASTPEAGAEGRE